jgi:hypothetical protein
MRVYTTVILRESMFFISLQCAQKKQIYISTVRSLVQVGIECSWRGGGEKAAQAILCLCFRYWILATWELDGRR